MALPAKQLSSKAFIEKAIRDLPPLPAVVGQLLELTGNEATSSSAIEQLLGSDQALSSKLLRVVNSSYFGLSKQVSSINLAVVILGFQQVRNLVLSVSALSMFESRTPRHREIQRNSWEHAFGAAAGAQTIAKRKRFDSRDQEIAFLGGLLHDLGRLFLFSTFTTTYQEVLRQAEESEINSSEIERRVFGCDHAEVGMVLAKAWNFPDQLILMIARHEGPFDGEPIPVLYAVHAADRVVTDALVGEGIKTVDCEIDPKVAEWLAFSEEDMEWLREDIRAKVEAAAETLDLM